MKTGTTFLIQGAPGAGKSALLGECEKLAQSQGWKTVEIKPPAFWDPSALRDFIGLRKFSITGGSLQIGPKNIASAAINVDWSRKTILKMLGYGKQPLLLTLDEAQTLGTGNAPPSDHTGTAINVLDAIHNGKLNKPVILAAAGLGTTAQAFGSLGISRFEGESFIELDALGKDATRAVLHDWLTKEGGAKGDPEKWIHAIARETHGWPQHIVSYVKPALKQLVTDERAMTTEGLNTVLEAGCVLREAYYEQRAAGLSRKKRHSLAKIIASVPLEDGLDQEDIIASLAQEYGEAEAKNLFDRARHKGILYERRGVYAVPIPSMHHWLVSNYAHIQIKSPHEAQTTRGSRGKSFSRNLER